MATLIGVLFASDWLLGAAFVATWLLMALLFRYASLSAIVTAALTPLYSWLLLEKLPYLLCFGLMSAILIWRHRSNIRNLIAGTENKIGTNKP